MQAALRFSFLAGAAAVTLLAACPIFAADWTEHRSEAGNYVVRFPGVPKTSVQTVNTDLGKIELHAAVVELKEKDVAYKAVHAKLPAVVENFSADQRLENVKAAIIGTGFTLTTAKKINLGAFPGLELQGSDSKGQHLRARLYIVNVTMYQIMLLSKNEKHLSDDDANKFVDSFKLLSTPDKK
jgi:hypothetical protein